MPDKQTSLTKVPPKDVGKILQGWVNVGATQVSGTQDENKTWTLSATIPDNSGAPAPPAGP